MDSLKKSGFDCSKEEEAIAEYEKFLRIYEKNEIEILRAFRPIFGETSPKILQEGESKIDKQFYALDKIRRKKQFIEFVVSILTTKYSDILSYITHVCFERYDEVYFESMASARTDSKNSHAHIKNALESTKALSSMGYAIQELFERKREKENQAQIGVYPVSNSYVLRCVGNEGESGQSDSDVEVDDSTLLLEDDIIDER